MRQCVKGIEVTAAPDEFFKRAGLISKGSCPFIGQEPLLLSWFDFDFVFYILNEIISCG